MDKKMKCVVGFTANGTKVFATKRTVTSHVHLSVPESKIRSFVQNKGIGTYDAGRQDIRARNFMLNQSDFEIISQFNAELRGFSNFYCLAPAYYLSKLEWMMHICLFKTLARKHNISWAKMARRMRMGRGNYSLKYQLEGVDKFLPVFRLKDRNKRSFSNRNIDHNPNLFVFKGRTKLLDRLNAKLCEYCGNQDGPMQVHHIRKMKDVSAGKSTWEKMMIAKRRKTLVLCQSCHIDLHRGTLPDKRHAVPAP
jgi:hypothetical protein